MVYSSSFEKFEVFEHIGGEGSYGYSSYGSENEIYESWEGISYKDAFILYGEYLETLWEKEKTKYGIDMPGDFCIKIKDDELGLFKVVLNEVIFELVEATE